ncbi:DUF1345 domain-containing protein [Actinomadura gamaensis]|uniref:DUF1345 domain-containing protein n=1 Tax=Actinomadura gamaensis TaxID=1763541 RepID=A0ABV9U458_9ACTN
MVALGAGTGSDRAGSGLTIVSDHGPHGSLLGTSSATFDVNVLTSPMRRKVAAHSVLGFLFHAVVVAVAIDWIKA